MNELIKVNYEDNNSPTIMGRELHNALEVKTAYKDWFPRMCAYGFTENTDYVAIAQKRATGQGNTTTYIDHRISLDMAKELCMIQRTEKGKTFRQYFIEIEKAWNSPEMVMTRAYQLAQQQLENFKVINLRLQNTIKEQQPKVNLANLRIDKLGCYSITDVTKTLGLKKGQITKWAKVNGYLHKLQQEVNKFGEEYFKIYSKDGIHNQIGITDKGLSYINSNISDIQKF